MPYKSALDYAGLSPLHICRTEQARHFLPRCRMQTRSIAMRILSVCPSVKCVHCDKTEERSVQIFIPYERSF